MDLYPDDTNDENVPPVSDNEGEDSNTERFTIRSAFMHIKSSLEATLEAEPISVDSSFEDIEKHVLNMPGDP